MGAEDPEKSWNNSPERANKMQARDQAANEHVVALDPAQAGSQTTGESTEKKADVAPNGGYGWVCVAACATING